LHISDYCRQIETYLCQKNDGHLVRVVGPSFDLVSGWEARGVPLKVALRGIDRYFERYYRKGPRRRPVKIDFCDADVLDVFEEWQRAVGVSCQSPVVGHQSSDQSRAVSPQGGRQSLPAHLERVLIKLTNARARGVLGGAFDDLIDRVASELDTARAKAGGVRGAAREQLIARLLELDGALLQQARSGLGAADRTALDEEAGEELSGYRAAMTPEAFERARAAVADRLIRERFDLPIIALA